MTRPIRSIVLTAAVLASLLAYAQPKPTVSLTLGNKAPKAGQMVKGTVRVAIPAGWHAYQNPPSNSSQIPLKVSITGPGVQAVRISYPRGVMKMAAGEQSAVYEGALSIPVEMRLTTAGRHQLTVKLDYQLCDDSTCMPPSSLTARTAVTVSKP